MTDVERGRGGGRELIMAMGARSRRALGTRGMPALSLRWNLARHAGGGYLPFSVFPYINGPSALYFFK